MKAAGISRVGFKLCLAYALNIEAVPLRTIFLCTALAEKDLVPLAVDVGAACAATARARTVMVESILIEDSNRRGRRIQRNCERDEEQKTQWDIQDIYISLLQDESPLRLGSGDQSQSKSARLTRTENDDRFDVQTLDQPVHCLVSLAMLCAILHEFLHEVSSSMGWAENKTFLPGEGRKRRSRNLL